MTSHARTLWVRHSVGASVRVAKCFDNIRSLLLHIWCPGFPPRRRNSPACAVGWDPAAAPSPPPPLLSPHAASGAESWPAECMQQNGSSASNGSGGCGGRERQSPSFSPLPAAATTRVRRFIQERRTLPLPRVMVVFSGAGDGDKPGDAMSGSEPAEDDARQPASHSPNRAPSKPPRSSLNSQEQEVGRRAGNACFHSNEPESTTGPYLWTQMWDY